MGWEGKLCHACMGSTVSGSLFSFSSLKDSVAAASRSRCANGRSLKALSEHIVSFVSSNREVFVRNPAFSSTPAVAGSISYFVYKE